MTQNHYNLSLRPKLIRRYLDMTKENKFPDIGDIIGLTFGPPNARFKIVGIYSRSKTWTHMVQSANKVAKDWFFEKGWNVVLEKYHGFEQVNINPTCFGQVVINVKREEMYFPA